MKISIKDLSVAMEVKNNGVEFEVRDTKDSFLGDFHVTRSGVVWCKGKTNKSNGKKLTWKNFIEIMEK